MVLGDAGPSCDRTSILRGGTTGLVTLFTRTRRRPLSASASTWSGPTPSGSWQVRRMDTQIGKNFDWIAVPNPCGPAACTGIPGGAAFVALKRTKSPKEVARFLDVCRAAETR